MENIIRRPMFDDGRSIGTSFFAGAIELHLPSYGRPEIYVGDETIDAGLLVVALPEIVRLFTDPVVRAQVMRACKGT